MSAKTKITPRENGPLVVTDPPVLRRRGGDEIDTKDVAALCRCGQSGNKPFCDGSHNAAGFDSAPDLSEIRNSQITYTGTVEGREVTIGYTPVLCSHAGECSRLARNVFNPSQKPWIKPEAGSTEKILEVMAACPSGALRVSIAEAPAAHLVAPGAEIEIEPHGPYWVKNVPLEAEFNGVGAAQSKYVLCRCGKSKNKPFCDGTHYDIKWRDDA
ncbi:MAG: CDGSH iron-sulfur domain-containing protein [Alphaproteobacteria bacterium]|nr:CDGSH iron-sulfur domain-containing protein [Alphaproteobacteria bacterium]